MKNQTNGILLKKLPILLITYKRLDTTTKVLTSIKKYQPEVIYIFSDGAKKINEDEVKIRDVRRFLKSNIDWNCKVVEFFSEENLGCKYGPQKAISWFFQQVEMGIILEDDTVPNEYFFKYCEVLLNKYKNNLDVWNIAGTTMDSHHKTTTNSYRFSHFPHTWGWATWANRWNNHINKLPQLLEDAKTTNLKDIFPNDSIVKNWEEKARISFTDQLDAWDYLWSFRILLEGGISTSPNKNLISNIGFGEDATHTASKHTNISNTEKLTFPLIHPSNFLPDTEKDVLFFEQHFNWKPFSKKINPSHLLKVIKSRLNLR